MGEARRAPAVAAIDEGEVDEALEAEVSSVLAAYGGDARAAVRALILENAFLENQVEEAVAGISVGYVRARLRAGRGR